MIVTAAVKLGTDIHGGEFCFVLLPPTFIYDQIPAKPLRFQSASVVLEALFGAT